MNKCIFAMKFRAHCGVNLGVDCFDVVWLNLMRLNENNGVFLYCLWFKVQFWILVVNLVFKSCS